MTAVRLAVSLPMFKELREDFRPFSALVTYPIVSKFLEFEYHKRVSTWAMDSGAFSVFAAGKTIDLNTFIEDCHKILQRPNGSKPTEIFALDVIGDPTTSLANARTMRAAGLDVIPTFHHGEPFEYLKELAAEWPKIAIGGTANFRPEPKLKFAEQCFARVWPKRIHGFAYAFRRAVLRFPFHSVDSATSWIQAGRFHKIDGYGSRVGSNGGDLLAINLDRQLALETHARSRWHKEMELLKEKP